MRTNTQRAFCNAVFFSSCWCSLLCFWVFFLELFILLFFDALHFSVFFFLGTVNILISLLQQRNHSKFLFMTDWYIFVWSRIMFIKMFSTELLSAYVEALFCVPNENKRRKKTNCRRDNDKRVRVNERKDPVKFKSTQYVWSPQMKMAIGVAGFLFQSQP